MWQQTYSNCPGVLFSSLNRTPFVFSAFAGCVVQLRVDSRAVRGRRVMRRSGALLAAVLLLGLGACREAREGAPRDAASNTSRADAETTVATLPQALNASEHKSVASLDTVDDFGAALPSDARDAARVVSLNPAFTEIVFAIGAGHRLVGRTAWDNRPQEALAVANVGAGIRPNVEAVLAVRPTLVLLYATAENQAAADAFARAGIRTLSLRTVTIGDFRRAAHALGRAMGEEAAARTLVDTIDITLNRVRAAVTDAPRPRVVWPSWESPVLVVGNASYEAELLTIAGAQNVFADRSESVAGVTIEEIARRDPDIVLAGPERIARLRSSSPWRAVRAVREGHVAVLDTNVVGRPGVTIGMAAVAIARVLHPERAGRLP